MHGQQQLYTGTGLHLHDVISASDMYCYFTWSGNTAPDNKVKVTKGLGLFLWENWLPDITDWKTERLSVAYNVSDYVVAK